MGDTNGTTQLVNALAEGDADAAEKLLPAIYDELHRIAQRHFQRQSAGHTLQPTALVNEAFVRLIDRGTVAYRGREHFMAVAALAMRQVLVDHARRQGAQRRGGGAGRVTLSAADMVEGADELDVLALDEALVKLAAVDERASKVVALRFFGGLGNEEVAEALGVARSTVAEDWRFARTWLAQAIGA